MKTTKTYTVEEAKRHLERYCAYQDRSHFEVLKKLREMQMIPMVIDAIVLHLIEHNFLNEARFAKSFVRGKFNIKKYGRIKITQGLKQNRQYYSYKRYFLRISLNAFRSFCQLAFMILADLPAISCA